MTLPTIKTYGNYSSDNYGAHALCVTLPRGEGKANLVVYFSYQTPVAFEHPQRGLVCRHNQWGSTTGKHLNAIQPDHKKRVDGAEFERLFQESLTD